MKKLVIFDLDGTLLNTIADLAQSTNYALQACGYPIHEISAYKYFVGDGINKLFERALPDGERTQEQIQKIRSLFIPYYDRHNTDLTIPYPNIETLLETLQDSHFNLAVASNKYQSATKKLVRHYFPTIHFSSVLGQREGIPTKPNAQIVYDSMKAVNVSPEETIYVGDSDVDMQTARNAGVEAIGVAWGFRPIAELQVHHPLLIAEQVLDILNAIK